MSVFHFKCFDVSNERAAMKLGTDSVLLGSLAMVRKDMKRVLDVGTGTGVVALMVAQRLAGIEEDYLIDAIDIDAPSVEEASDNFLNSPWAEHLKASRCPLADWKGTYDLVVSNPPYFDDSLLNPDLRKSVTRHTIGLSFRELCEFSTMSLSEKGILSMVLPIEVEKALMRTAVSFSLYPYSLIRIKTTDKKPPKRIVVNFGREKRICETRELTMYSSGEITSQYHSLVDSFLVNL